MATSTRTFSAQINDWVSQTEQRMEAVFKESARRVISEAQANVPVVTGNLKSSLQVNINGSMPLADRSPAPGANHSTPAIAAVIAGAKLGDTIYAGYTMNYAGFVEYGTSKMAPRRFVGRAVARWQQTVNQVSLEAKNRALSGFSRLS